MIKAPYNFVPVDDKVVCPPWAPFISQDIPFEDAQSGAIPIKITAHSPIFVRKGSPKSPGAENQPAQTDFSQYGGRYFIPGSSIRGMIRNVLEIMTFSKMGGKVDDNRYAIRDLSDKAKEIYRNSFKVENTFGGWLWKDQNEGYHLIDCGIPGRISHVEIDNYSKTNFAGFFGENGDFDNTDNQQKSAKFKYDLFGDKKRLLNFDSIGKNTAGARLYAIDDMGQQRGTLVFTGQPDKRKFSQEENKFIGKHYEFIFFDTERKIELPESVVKDFLFAYRDHDDPGEDWIYWKTKLEAGERIPVFFHKQEKNATTIGLSYLFKLPYKKSVGEALPPRHKLENPDFSESIFGFVNSKSELQGLKGRVFFSTAFAKEGTAHAEQVLRQEVLSSPKASYYPTYIRQVNMANGKVKGPYQTFMHDNARIAGWKRYPIHRKGTKSNPRPGNSTERVEVRFLPLQEGAVFECTLHYHNLKKIELGALLSALTFHQTPGTFHSLGMAKPLGYGKVTLEVGISKQKQEEYLRCFEAYMKAEGIPNWHEHNQIVELITMASEAENKSDSHLDYMKLDMERSRNEFANSKKAGEALDLYSKLGNGITKQKTATPLVGPTEIQKAQDEKARWETLKNNYKNPLDYFDREMKSFEEGLRRAKQELLQQIEQRKEHLQRELSQRKKAQGSATAIQGEPSWDKVRIKHREAFEDLKKVVHAFVVAINKGERYDQLIKSHPEGNLLPERLHGKLKEHLKAIFSHLSKKEKKRWLKPYKDNAFCIKVAEWIGKDAASDFFTHLTP